MSRGRVIALAAWLAASGACTGRVVEVGEVLVIVDTDMPVPAFVGRLRVDLYDATGRWYASRDVERSRPSAWPASFGVHVTDVEGERVVTVRLRAFPEDGTRDYRGERFQPRPPPTTRDEAVLAAEPPPATGEPRLVEPGGADVTPSSEPQPLLTVDRLLRVRVRPGVRAAARVVLRGECVGTMADLAGARTCVDREGELVPVDEALLDDDRTVPSASLAGSFDPKGDCAAPPREGSASLFDAQVCVPGAMFRFGTPDGILAELPALPERVVVLDPFLVDRFELTVARYRAAVLAGFVSPDPTPIANEADIPTAPPFVADRLQCTWSAAPRGREAYPLNCVSWETARAVCRFLGGDLPTEAQWDYVAAASGRPFRTRFAWGGPDDVVPTCARAIWGRSGDADGTGSCRDDFGPAPVDARMGEGGDVTPTLGVVGLGASVGEHTRDAFAPMTAPCWASASIRNTSCEVESDEHTTRGGSWFDDAAGLILGQRRGGTLGAGYGFRCVYPAGGSR